MSGTPTWQNAGRCPACGKLSYQQRRDAKRARKILRKGGAYPGTPLTIYPCPVGNGLHLGHMPPEVRNGKMDRQEYRDRVIQRFEEPE